MGYLCFTANTAGSTVELSKYGSPSWTGYYSTDGITWTEYTPGTTGIIWLRNAGDVIYFKGTHTAEILGDNCLHFTMTGSIAASGNIMSLCCGDNFESVEVIPYANIFRYLFRNCTSLTTPPFLPATTLSKWCYYFMFSGCTSLTTAPALPATTLANHCYEGMFVSCSALYASDSIGTGHMYEWRVPTTGTFENATDVQEEMFANCLGTRTSDNLRVTIGGSRTLYTQNEPISPTPATKSINKVEYLENGIIKTLIDLTSDTITAEDLRQSVIAHNAAGKLIVGTAVIGGIEEISTAEEMDALLTEENVGNAYRYTGTTGTYINGDLYIVEEE